MAEPILDLPPEPRKRRRFSAIAFVAFGLLIVGMWLKLMHYSYADLALLLGGGGMVLRNVLVVVYMRPRPQRLILFYFGYSLLVIGLVGRQLSGEKTFMWLVTAAVGIFFILFLVRLKKT